MSECSDVSKCSDVSEGSKTYVFSSSFLLAIVWLRDGWETATCPHSATDTYKQTLVAIFLAKCAEFV